MAQKPEKPSCFGLDKPSNFSEKTDMKFWRNSKYDVNTITMLDGDQDRIINITRQDGGIIFQEACDDYFKTEMDETRAIAVLQEAIDWIGGTRK